MMKKLSSLLFLVIATVIITGSCDKEDPQGGNNEDQINTPTVTTGEVTNIESTTATCFGNVKADGGATVTARGVCWSTAENPSTSDSKTTDGTGKGTYTSNLTDLTPDTQYYARAYATNSKGTAYGQQKAFKTQDEIFTDSRDGKVYKYVTIGNQVWMAENLAYLPSVFGPATISSSTAYYYVYDYNGTDVAAAKATDNYQTYGVLYNWPAAMAGAASSDANPSGVQGVCPDGWHLPSDAEWTQLEEYLIANGYNYDGTTTGNQIAKSMANYSGWNTSSTVGAVGNTDYPEYRNKSGFTSLPGGYRSSFGAFGDIGRNGTWWSSTQDSTNNAWRRTLIYRYSSVLRYSYTKDYGFSVRCIRD